MQESIISEYDDLCICNSANFVFVDIMYLHYITVFFVSVAKASKCGKIR